MGHALWQWDVVYEITALQIFTLHEMRLKQASVREHELQHRSDEEIPSSLWAHPYKFFSSTKDAQHFAKQVWVYTPAVLRQSNCMMLWGKQWYRNLLISKWKTKCVLVCLSVFPHPFVCLLCMCVCVCVFVFVFVYGWVDCCWNYTLSVPFKDKNLFIFQSQMQPQGWHVLTTGWSSDFQTDAHFETLMWGRTDARDRWETWGRKYESISLHLQSSRSLKPIRPFELIIGVILTNEHVFSFKQALWETPRQSKASECDIKRQHKSQLHYFLCKDAVCVGLTPPHCCDSA